jgi:MFS family permease
LGGIFADAGFWRGVFFINLTLAVAAVWMLRAVPETRDEDAPPRLDYPGALLTVLGLAGLTYGLIRLGKLGVGKVLSQPRTLIGLAAGIVLLGIFTWWESHTLHPLVNLNLFRSRTFSGANLMTGFLYAALCSVTFFLPLNLIQVQGYSSAVAGFTFLPFSILLVALSPLAGSLADRYGLRVMLTIGPLIVGSGFAALALPRITDGPSAYWTTYFPGVALTGLGMGITVAPLTSTVIGAVPSQQSGTASGINNAVSRQGQVVGLAPFGAVALGAFSLALSHKLDNTPLTSSQVNTLQSRASDLANTTPPTHWQASTIAAANRAIDEAFITTFRPLMLLGTVLCVASAVFAALVIAPDAGQPSGAAQSG